ncbi:4-hydroxythreonine-4-phosphate dehydrogenase [Halomonas citrativorans]|uniref:4-hydroxythreonine-4-phosphate dehydrogenase n=1 Tax=Halomonas citrativorans TaxID=2742612 RepID=A0A1R4I3X7_9GAMM|nr:4-hydroxythreonine-4-phosphate dehydrogenase [Halomonas citrativorans]
MADDLTGTADSAIGCARAGLTTAVVLGADHIECADAVAIDLDSRGESAAEAARRHRQALFTWQGRFHFLYKKVDSTLRGNAAAEVASLVAIGGMAIVAPAYPATGRTTHGGRQYLDGIPIEETEVWTNEGIQGRADLVEMFNAAALKTATFNLAALGQDDDNVVAALIAHRESGVQTLVCDAESDADLARLAALSTRLDGVFWVGSAGLGDHLPAALGLVGTREPIPTLAAAPHTLIVIGSMSAISHQQADRLLESIEALTLIEIDAIDLRADAHESAFQTLEMRIDEALEQKRDVMVRLRQGNDRNAAEGPALSLALARLLSPRLERVERLIATGGATARALLVGADVTQLTLLDAPDTGMARLLAETSTGRLEVITKAGGFGDSSAFERIWHGQTRNH